MKKVLCAPDACMKPFSTSDSKQINDMYIISSMSIVMTVVLNRTSAIPNLIAKDDSTDDKL
jgi:hypothetical protein